MVEMINICGAACRVANVGILSVKRLASSFPAASIEQPASATPITLDVDQDSDLFIGGVPDDWTGVEILNQK